jgi:hypothetical protein
MALPTRLFGASRLIPRPVGLGTAVAGGSGVQLARTGELSNSYAGWRPLEFSSRRHGSNENAGDAPAFSFEMALPTRFELVLQP